MNTKKPQIFSLQFLTKNCRGLEKSKYIKKLCFQNEVINFLNFIYGRKPVPISTINFLKGTEQPLHSDYIHFGSTLNSIWQEHGMP